MSTDPSPKRSSVGSLAGSLVSSKARSFVRSLTATNVYLRKQTWIWPIIAGVLLGTIGWFLRGAIESELRRDMESELQTILNADVTALKIWIRSQEQIAETAASNPRVATLAQALVENAAQPDVEQLELLKAPELASLRAELKPFLEAHGYDGFLMLSPQGKVIAALRNDPIGLAIQDDDSTENLKRVLGGTATVSLPMKSKILLQDKNGELRAGMATMFALAPIRNAEETTIAVLGLRIRPEDEFTEILRVASVGASGETYAFNSKGLLLSQSRFDDDLRATGLLTEDAESLLNVQIRDPGVNLTEGKRAEKKRSEQPLTMMAAEAVTGKSGVSVVPYRDYRGVPVVGAWTWLPEYGLGVTTEVDASEAFAPLYILRFAFWSMFALLFLASVAIFVFTIVVARLNREARRATLEAKQLGQYTLDTKLGEGGMGVVYRARHAMLQRPTAVKFLDFDKTNEQSVARFEREVRLTGQLNHPNTIAIYDYGRTPDGVFYYAMEYLDGVNLEDLVLQDGAQPEGRVIFILQQLCGSLTEAHGIQLIHRDIKPANIILTERGGLYDFVKLLDFGLVKALDSTKQSAATQAGSLTGTPLYLSPEAVVAPETVDARSDIYAVAAVGYYLLTGSPVFEGENVLQIIQQHASAVPESPSSRLGKPISPDLEELILQCLAKNPDERIQSCFELSERLGACASAGTWKRTDAVHWWESRQHKKTSAMSRPATLDGRFAATIVGKLEDQDDD